MSPSFLHCLVFLIASNNYNNLVYMRNILSEIHINACWIFFTWIQLGC